MKLYKKEYKKALKRGLKHKRNATVSTIKKFIDRDIPVLAEVDADKFYGKRFGYTHSVVVVGYDSKNFFVHDPDKELGKKLKKVSIKKFKKSWEKLLEGSGRSVTVIEPKRNRKK